MENKLPKISLLTSFQKYFFSIEKADRKSKGKWKFYLIVKNLTFLMPNLFLSDRWRHPRE